ncbi:MAG TPA: hypothetical protein VID77_10455 [Stellaceae bacterium]|jgi:hypothetical protein
MALTELFARKTRTDWGWTALLVATALASCITFECVTPFAAFAVLMAATMSLPRALATMVAVWLINQALGFLALGYPLDGVTLAWGAAIGVAALAATIAAGRMMAMARLSPVASVIAGFVVAFVVYEAVLIMASLVLGSIQNFTPDIVAKLALSDACWLVGVAILRHGLLRLEAIRRENRLAVRT